MTRRQPPETRAGWYALHDFRRVDWDAWRGAPARDREHAIEDGVAYLEAAEAVEDADEGASVTYAVTGHKADLLVVHFRPTLDDVNEAERRFEQTAFAAYTERATSFVSVTEASGYTIDDIDPEKIEDRGLANYIQMRLTPTIPDADYVCFYPMDKRRDPEQNWYDLPFDERAEHMKSHGDIGREYAGKVTQVVTGSIGFDDWEWGVTLFANDLVAVKDLLYEMRFDPSTSQFAEFGPFYVGQRLEPARLDAFLAGESLDASIDEHHRGASGAHEQSPRGSADEHHDESSDDPAEQVRDALADMDIYAGKPHGEDVYAMVVYSEADGDALFERVDGLRGNFDHYDTHVKTAVYDDPAGEHSAVVSLWSTARAAETAGGYLADLPGVVGRPDDEDGFGTMGMFYTVKPEHRGEFVDQFDAVGEHLGGVDGHRHTRLLVNREDENDMFIASQWDSQDDAVGFFRSDAFRDTVEWGREVLADRPRHVFLA